MIVTESFLRAKGNEISTCEDGFIVTEEYAVMIDGASAKSKLMINGKTTGRFIMEEIKEAIPHFEEGLNANEFVRALDKALLRSYEEKELLDIIKDDVKSIPEANVVVYSASRNELWFYGDAQAMVDGVHYTNPKYIDEITSGVRKMVNEYYLITKEKTSEQILELDEGAKFIKPLLAMQQYFHGTNHPTKLAYSCINGFGFEEEFIKIVKLGKEVKEIVLATDGYSELFMTVKETEDFLENVIKKDPIGINEFQTFRGVGSDLNSYDDRAYVKLRL